MEIATDAGIKVRGQPLASPTREEACNLNVSCRSLTQVLEQLSADAVRSAVLVAVGTPLPAGGSERNRVHA